MSTFEDVSKIRNSFVWRHFLLNKEKELAKCKFCHKELKAKGSSTKGLIEHLNRSHEEEVKKDKDEIEAEPPKKKKTMENYFTKREHSRQDLAKKVAMLAALDGLSFHCISSSLTLNELFQKVGFKPPKSPNFVRELVFEHAKEIKKQVRKEIKSMKDQDARFSISIDEYTSIKNRRYMNLNVHCNGGFFFNLGAIRVFGSMPAEKCVKLVQNHLRVFGLDMDKDIVAAVKDGATVMNKFGRDIKALSIVCLNHGIHLSVIDFLFKKNPSEDFENVEDEEDEEENDDEDDELQQETSFEVTEVLNDDKEMKENFQETIKKVRKICKLFRKSPVRNDENLQPQVMKALGKELKLALDVKTRWNSTVTMLRRFLLLTKEIKMALIQLDMNFDFSDDEITLLQDLVNALEPLELAITRLSGQETTLKMADDILMFTATALSDLKTELGDSLKDSFMSRMIERRNHEVMHLVWYLHDANYASNNKDDFFGQKIKKSCIMNLTVQLIERLFPQESRQEQEIEVEIVQEADADISLNQRLNNYLKGSSSSSAKPNMKVEQLVKKAMALYEASGNLNETKILLMLKDALSSIPPTSTEPERSFSSLGLFATKLRSLLSDASIDNLVFLRGYYKNKAKKE